MKKIFLAMVIFAALGISYTNAQTFAVGPTVSFAASSYIGDDVNRESFRKGFQAGAFFSFAPKEWFAVRPEILYDQRGSQSIFFNNISREIRVDYLTIPVALNFRIPLKGLVYPKFTAGPYASFALNEKQNLNVNNNTAIAFEETDVNRIDFGGFVGGGVDIEFDRIMLSSELRYLFGSVDVSQEDDLEFRNTQIALSFSFGFRF